MLGGGGANGYKKVNKSRILYDEFLENEVA